MTDENIAKTLARLEIGFRMDAGHLKELEAELAQMLIRVREFGKIHGTAGEWSLAWDRRWDEVKINLDRIKAEIDEMSRTIDSSDIDRLEKAMAAWKRIQFEDARLLTGLDGIREQACEMGFDRRIEWNLLTGPMDAHFDTIHACTEAVRVRLEFLTKYSREEVDQLVQNFLGKLPRRVEADVETYAEEYRQAVVDMDQERHRFMGFMDVVRALLMRVETPEVRLRKNRSLRLEENVALVAAAPTSAA